MFQLLKWYLDLVTEEGTLLVCYAARLRWGGARIGYTSLLHSPGTGPAHDATTIRRVRLPRFDDGDRTLTWASEPLDVAGRWTRAAPPIRQVLLDTPAGGIEWSCHLPRARGVIQWEGTEYVGWGYAESLLLTIPPWKVPFRTLWWGRHASESHAVVWIQWEGGERRRWIWLDGEAAPDACLGGAGVSGLGGGRELRLEPGREVRNRAVLEAITDPLPDFARRLGGSLAAMREHKRVSRSAVVESGRPLDHGWAVHEVVTW